VTRGVPLVSVRPVVVSVVVSEDVGARFVVGADSPATVNPPEVSTPVTTSLKVTTNVFTAVLSTETIVGGASSTAFAFCPSARSFVAAESSSLGRR